MDDHRLRRLRCRGHLRKANHQDLHNIKRMLDNKRASLVCDLKDKKIYLALYKGKFIYPVYDPSIDRIVTFLTERMVQQKLKSNYVKDI